MLKTTFGPAFFGTAPRNFQRFVGLLFSCSLLANTNGKIDVLHGTVNSYWLK